MPEDYYTTLGVHRNASPQEINKAYRELARKHHPDVNPGDPEAEKMFEHVQAAFEVLSDPERRATYNRTALSFTTVRKPPKNSVDDLAGRAFVDARKQAHRHRAPRAGSDYVPLMMMATVLWLVVVLVSVGLLHVVAFPDGWIPELRVAAAFDHGWIPEQAIDRLLGRLLFCGGTLLYTIVMAILLREHFNR